MWACLRRHGLDAAQLRARIDDVIVKALIAVEAQVTAHPALTLTLTLDRGGGAGDCRVTLS